MEDSTLKSPHTTPLIHAAPSRPCEHTRHAVFCLDLVTAVLQLRAKTAHYFVVWLFVRDSMFLALNQYHGTRRIMSPNGKGTPLWTVTTGL